MTLEHEKQGAMIMNEWKMNKGGERQKEREREQPLSLITNKTFSYVINGKSNYE